MSHNIKTWVEFVGAIAVDLLEPHGLGNWCPPGGNENIDTPVALSSSAFHYLDLVILSRTAKILGYKKDAEYYGTWKHKLRQRFNEAFYSRKNKTYGSQTANAMAIQLGLAPNEDQEAIVSVMVETDDLEGEGFLKTGIFGLGSIAGWHRAHKRRSRHAEPALSQPPHASRIRRMDTAWHCRDQQHMEISRL